MFNDHNINTNLNQMQLIQIMRTTTCLVQLVLTPCQLDGVFAHVVNEHLSVNMKNGEILIRS